MVEWYIANRIMGVCQIGSLLKWGLHGSSTAFTLPHLTPPYCFYLPVSPCSTTYNKL